MKRKSEKTYTKSEVDERVSESNKCLMAEYQKRVAEITQLKAKLKSQAEEIFDDVGKISTASPKAVEKGYWKMRKKWVGKE